MEQMLQKMWADIEDKLPAKHCLLRKLGSLRKKLADWNRVSFENVEKDLASIQTVIENFDLIAESRDLSPIKAERLHDTREQFRLKSKQAEVIWSQKSRLLVEEETIFHLFK
ncbi:hypothetical protein Tsubulata_011345 [Turnera subulata]|uniref:Uncharacterized protein n=1 Tax=Turnera subulata TaxID=218843 RepID=A0A9Q0JC46_9ROSI|nr:hypothetical protein Tsubulata_011345 [Turnera subulata]